MLRKAVIRRSSRHTHGSCTYRSLFLTALFALCATDAPAVTFKVNLTQDLIDAAPGDGVCSTNPALDPQQFALCTLRAAVMEGNATPLQKDVEIVLVPGATYKLTIPGADEFAAKKGDLDVLRTMRIGVPEGSPSKAKVDANKLDRAFDLFPAAASSELYGLEIVNGFGVRGAAVFSADGVRLRWLDIHDAVDSEDVGLPSAVVGGVTMMDSRVHHNGLSGISAGGGALTIMRSTVDHNAFSGIDVQGGSLSLHSSTVFANGKGAIYLRDSSGVIDTSTISGNETGLPEEPLNFQSVSAGNFSLSVTGSIVDGGDGFACRTTSHAQAEATFVSAWNIYSDASCLSDVFFDHSLHNAQINLSDLGDRGGPTPTRTPLSGSDAIDFAPASVCNQFGTDQRGLPRPVSTNGGMPRCDAGAVEVQAAPPVEPLPAPIFSDGFEDAI